MNDEVTDNPEVCVCGAALVEATDENGKMLPQLFAAYEKVGLEADWFTSPQWRKLWEAIKAEWVASKSLDSMLVARRFGEGGAAAVSDAMMATPTSSHAEYYVALLKDRHLATLLMRTCRKGMEDLTADNAETKIEETTKALMELQARAAQGGNDLVDVAAAAKRAVAEAEQLREERIVKGNKGFFIGLPWPWEIMNYYYSGLKPGLHVIAASPSVGKTAMAVNLSNFWNERGIKHGFISIDMTSDQGVRRYACLSKQVSLAKINWGANHEEIELYKSGFDDFMKHGNVDVSEEYRIGKIRDIMYRGVLSRGWKAVIIDYLQLVQDDARGNPPFYEQVRHVVATLKNLANHDLKIPVIALVQLSREYAKDNRKQQRRPGIEDLGDSAEIGRAAATVAVLERDQDVTAYWKKNPPCALAGGVAGDHATEHLAKMIRPVWMYLIKNQQGGTADIPFVMYPRYFLMRPGDWDAQPAFLEGDGGKGKEMYVPSFSLIRDDYMHTEFDNLLVQTGALVEEKRGMTPPAQRAKTGNLGI